MKPVVVSALLVLGGDPSFANWPINPGQNLPVCTVSYLHEAPAVAPDGQGGAIIVWQTYRPTSNFYDIYAQRVTSLGAVVWTAEGVPVVTAPNEQVSPLVVSDGSGGAIVVWVDSRTSSASDIYAQRLNAAGSVLWQANGVKVCDAPDVQSNHDILGTNDAGVVVVWTDHRNGSDDLYAQRLGADGSPLWLQNGVSVCGASGDQGAASLALGDGFVVAWTDDRGASGFDIYAQELSLTGAAQWAIDGVAVCTVGGPQYGAAVVPIGPASSGDVLIAWTDGRTSPNAADIYAQRIDANGVPGWSTNGIPVCAATNMQGWIAAMELGDETSLLCWSDYRNGSADLYANRMDLNGTMWGGDGLPIATAPYASSEPKLTSDGVGGAIVSWTDDRADPSVPDIYAQRVDPSGTILWQMNGVVVSNAAFDQHRPVIVSDESGGAIIAWEDWRDGGLEDQQYKIFAQRIGPDGNLGTPTSVGPAPTPDLGHLDVSPNPFTRETTLNVSLDRASALRIEVFDVAGRRVMTRSVPELSAGTHRISLTTIDGGGRELVSGVYLCRVSSSNGTRVAKLVVAR